MNQPKKISVVLGIVAAIGAANSISLPQWGYWPQMMRCGQDRIYVAKAKKSPGAGSYTVTCTKCGAEYDQLLICTLGAISREEVIHAHLSPEQKAIAREKAMADFHRLEREIKQISGQKKRRALLLETIKRQLQETIELYS